MNTRGERQPASVKKSFALVVGVVVGEVLFVLLVFATGPFESLAFSIWFGVVLSGLVHATLAALFVREWFEEQRWGTLSLCRRSLTSIGALMLVLVSVAVVVLDRYFTAWLSGSQAPAYVLAAIGGVSAGACIEWKRLRTRAPGVGVRSSPPRRRADGLVPFMAGIAAGVLAALMLLAGGALWHNTTEDRFEAMIAPISGIEGPYYAFGDSYSAGEGIPPYERGTQKRGGDGCHRSTRAYPELLTLVGSRRPVFRACSGAVIGDIYGKDRFARGPQTDRAVHDAGLVTVTIGGNDMHFSDILTFCFVQVDCMDRRYQGRSTLRGWIDTTMSSVASAQEALYRSLRRDFPGARVLVIGYPYLFPADPVDWWPPSHCTAILRRLDQQERAAIRRYTDEFNEQTRRKAVAADLEYVSPVDIWNGHEPCGDRGQFTNTVKPYRKGGAFHPNRSGQEALAQLVSCYLASHPDAPSVRQTVDGLAGPAPGAVGNPIECPS